MDPEKIKYSDILPTAVRVVRAPAEFFNEMPKTGGFVNPLIFIVFMGFVAGVVYALSGVLGLGYIKTNVHSSLMMLISMPIGAVIGSFVFSTILFFIWKFMGSQENYETSFRCVAYLTALSPVVAILALLPYAGGIINSAIYLYFIVIVSIKVHNIPSQRAWVAFGVVFIMFALWGLRSEHKVRNQQWKKETKEIEKTEIDLQKQTEEMARQYQKKAENNQKQIEQGK